MKPFDRLRQDLRAGTGSGPGRVPARLGKYELVREVGRGGMGVVYEAIDPDLGRSVAVKVLHPERLDSTLVRRLQREAMIAAKLHHPSIAAVHDVGTAPDEQGGELPYIVMEYVEGPTLARMLEKRAAPRARLVEILEEVTRAVAHAHQAGVVHRDLKPSNVVVQASGRVVLMDFGLAVDESAGSRLTASHAVLGTPCYMSPEQVEGRARDIDARTDVYSLGVLLYEILAGRPPFTGRTPVELYGKIRHGNPPPLPTDAGALATICRKALEKDRRHRYGSAAELADDLARFRRGTAVRARPPGAWRRLLTWAARRRVAAVIAGAILVTAGAGSLVVPRWREGTSRRQILERALEHERILRERTELLAPLERDLDLLVERFYRPDFRMTDAVFAEYDGHVERIRDLMRQHGESPEGWTLIGRFREAKCDYPGAEEAYGRAMECASEHVPALLACGQMLLEQSIVRRFCTLGDPRTGSARASEERTKLLSASASRGASLVSRGVELSKSAGDYQQLLAQAYLLALEGFGAACDGGHRKARSWERWLGRPLAEKLMLAESVCGAKPERLALREEVVRRVPSWPQARLWRGVARAMVRQDIEAEEDFTMALKLNPRCAEALLLRGVLRRRKGDATGALSDYDRATALNPKLTDAYLNRGVLKLDAGHWAGAIEDFTRALQLEPRVVAAYTNRSLAYRASGELDRAQQDIEIALQIDPDCAEAYNGRASMRLDKGDLDGALEDYDRALSLQPNGATFWRNRGLVRWRKGYLREAVDDYDRCIALDPEMPFAHLNRGTIKEKLGDLSGAASDYERAVELQPRHHRVYYARGTFRANRGDYAAGIDDLTRALYLAPDDPDSLAQRGIFREVAGDIPGAVEDWRRALAVASPEWPHRSLLEAKLNAATGR